MSELRWKQRFSNFESSYTVFLRRLSDFQSNPDLEAQKMALVQAFEITVELVWKIVKDFLENEGHLCRGPKDAIRQAYQLQIIPEAEGWLVALEKRNETTHTYDPGILDQIVTYISGTYSNLLEDWYRKFQKYLV